MVSYVQLANLNPTCHMCSQDEPTSGLDATSAKVVMVVLKFLASLGRTIVFSIHQVLYKPTISSIGEAQNE